MSLDTACRRSSNISVLIMIVCIGLKKVKLERDVRDEAKYFVVCMITLTVFVPFDAYNNHLSCLLNIV